MPSPWIIGMIDTRHVDFPALNAHLDAAVLRQRFSRRCSAGT